MWYVLYQNVQENKHFLMAKSLREIVIVLDEKNESKHFGRIE